MVYFGIGLAAIIGALLIWDFIKPKFDKKNFYNHLKTRLNRLSFDFKLFDAKKLSIPGDYLLEINQKKYLIKLIIIPKYAEIIVNAKTTWELRYGAGNTIGKAHPIKKYLPNMSTFMNYAKSDIERLIVFKPDTKKKVRYLNESEMEFLTPFSNVYGVRVLNNSELIEYLNK